ncbi:ABC transporter permease [Virgisporangium aurantiacum]|uniref:ABC transporter permease n=1 Tax=Virgisporangium aurantiacum TaxID=175570 RepID=A0A8J3ZGL4_9ACTN|nr:ABC transporter permease subunit [Virgisporangium aurantiacum]GIJ62433.1 ABC transporter permease [Virgisporangium aurantiacum]
MVRSGRARRRREGPVLTAMFLGPAAVMLTVLVVYPMGYTIWLSLHGGDTGHWVGLDNYRTMFTSPGTRRAITNNIVWMLIAPTVVTALGLVLAVLTERLRLRTALRAVVFMPMAISFLAAGITFRMVYDESPDRGVVNAAVVAVHDAFKPPSKYHGATPRDDAALATDHGAVVTAAPVAAGSPVLLPLVGLPATRVPDDARPAGTPASTGLSGVVWLDFTRGGGGQPGVVDGTEPGLPDVSVEVLRDGAVVGRATTDASGRFSFPELTGTGYLVRLPASNFTPPSDGLVWLGPGLVTPAVIGAYIWIWAGFAMVFIAAGLAAIPRDALEAARIDGATEWQTFRLVTIPLLRPVLVVVLVTLAINVLKIFDLVYVLPPESSQDDATVIALEMYRVSFGGDLDYGLGSALGVMLFVLVLPAMLFNIRRLRRDQ